MTAQPDPHDHHLWEDLRDAAIEAELETGRREESVEEARAAIHVRLARMSLGTLVVVAGVLLIPLPGPGWLVVAGGLAILAKDVAWAERLLLRVRRRLPSDADGSLSTPVIVASVAFATVSASASVWWYLLR
jgi:uncharacterized protein (TIGR02611 family)